MDKIIMENGRGVGVHIVHEDRVLRAKAVMSTLDPHTTFLDMVGEAELPTSLRDAVNGWVWDKWSFNTLHIAADEAPKYVSDDPWNDAFATIVGIESVEGLLAHWVSTYPGGLVLGGPGYLGANKGAEDLGVTKWWKPTPVMERYIKTYLE